MRAPPGDHQQAVPGPPTTRPSSLALAVLREHASVEVQATGDPGELDGVLHRAGSRRIIVAGGDGSLHAVVAALYRRNDLPAPSLGLLPLGTGNDFARGTGIPLDIEEAARLILDGEVTRPMDLLVDEVGEIVVNNVHVGRRRPASRRSTRWKDRLGSVGYKKVNLGKLGYPIGAAMTACEAAGHPAARRGGRRGASSTWTSRS